MNHVAGLDARAEHGAQGEGVGIYQINTRSGFRSSSANEHLRKARRRRNLEVLLAATLEASLTDHENKVEPAEQFHAVMDDLSGRAFSA